MANEWRDCDTHWHGVGGWQETTTDHRLPDGRHVKVKRRKTEGGWRLCAGHVSGVHTFVEADFDGRCSDGECDALADHLGKVVAKFASIMHQSDVVDELEDL